MSSISILYYSFIFEQFLVKIGLGTLGYAWEDLLPPSKLEIRLDTPKRYAWDFWRFLAIFFQKGTHGYPYFSWKFLSPPLTNFQMYPAVPFSPPLENFVSTSMPKMVFQLFLTNISSMTKSNRYKSTTISRGFTTRGQIQILDLDHILASLVLADRVT